MAKRRSVSQPRTLLGTTVAIVVAIAIWLFTDGGNGTDNDSARTESTAATTAVRDETDSSVGGGPVDTSPDTTDAPATTARPTTAAPAEPSDATEPAFADGFDTIDVADLPPEARDTLELIDEGGPFPYDQDGAVFQNREGILPDRPPGYYHEFTVESPGSDDRGARRIITGEKAEIFYTDDHYDSFRAVLL